MEIYFWDYPTTGLLRKTFTHGLSLNANYNLKITYDASANVNGIKLFVNDLEIPMLANLSSGSYSRMSKEVRGMNLGGIAFAGGYGFLGTMDNFKIYDTNNSNYP